MKNKNIGEIVGNAYRHYVESNYTDFNRRTNISEAPPPHFIRFSEEVLQEIGTSFSDHEVFSGEASHEMKVFLSEYLREDVPLKIRQVASSFQYAYMELFEKELEKCQKVDTNQAITQKWLRAAQENYKETYGETIENNRMNLALRKFQRDYSHPLSVDLVGKERGKLARFFRIFSGDRRQEYEKFYESLNQTMPSF